MPVYYDAITHSRISQLTNEIGTTTVKANLATVTVGLKGDLIVANRQIIYNSPPIAQQLPDLRGIINSKPITMTVGSRATKTVPCDSFFRTPPLNSQNVVRMFSDLGPDGMRRLDSIHVDGPWIRVDMRPVSTGSVEARTNEKLVITDNLATPQHLPDGFRDLDREVECLDSHGNVITQLGFEETVRGSAPTEIDYFVPANLPRKVAAFRIKVRPIYWVEFDGVHMFPVSSR